MKKRVFGLGIIIVLTALLLSFSGVAASAEKPRGGGPIKPFSLNEFQQRAVEEKVDEIAEECRRATSGDDEYEIALWLHDWLTTNANYDYTYTLYDPYGVLIMGYGVCQSYSEAYALLLDEFGIENQLVLAYEMNHAWNLVKIDGEWCHIDCTWDDPGIGGSENHNYFGMSDALISRDHVWEGEYPEAVSDNNLYAVRMGLPVVRDRASLDEYLIKMAEQKETEFDVIYIGTQADFDLMKEFDDRFELNYRRYGVISYSYRGNEYSLSVVMGYFDESRLYEDHYAYRINGNTAEIIFYDGPDSEQLIIPATLGGYPVASIDTAAFMGYTGIKSLTIPESVKKISLGAFAECSAITDVYYLGTESEWSEIFIAPFNAPITDATLHCNNYFNPFDDVKDGQWYTDAVLWAYEKGYMDSTGGNSFSRKTNVTRAMFATILAKIDGADLSAYTEMSFSDVKTGQWYSSAIEWAYQKGYASGVGTDEGNTPIFGRKADVTRETLALFFYTYSKQNGIDVNASADLSAFEDADRIHAWALDAVEWAVAKGLISGTSTTSISPRASATRAEFAIIIKSYVENVKNA